MLMLSFVGLAENKMLSICPGEFFITINVKVILKDFLLLFFFSKPLNHIIHFNVFMAIYMDALL